MSVNALSSSSGPRVLIIADSLALPREDVDYDHTWPALLAAALPAVVWINRAMRLSTTERLVTEGDGGTDCMERYQPALAILQLGICDCAPRVLHRRISAIVYRLPFALGASLSALLERWRGRKVSNCYVPLAAYEQNLRTYLVRAKAENVQVIAVATLPASQLLALKSPGVAGQIAVYNAVLDRLALEFDGFRVLFPFQGMALIDELFADGLHPNEQGARHIAAGLAPLVRQALHRAG